MTDALKVDTELPVQPVNGQAIGSPRTGKQIMHGGSTEGLIMPRMTFRERVLAGIIASCLAIAILGPCEPRPRSSTVVTEDSPGWDCHTMGNKICGPGKE